MLLRLAPFLGLLLTGCALIRPTEVRKTTTAVQVDSSSIKTSRAQSSSIEQAAATEVSVQTITTPAGAPIVGALPLSVLTGGQPLIVEDAGQAVAVTFDPVTGTIKATAQRKETTSTSRTEKRSWGRREAQDTRSDSSTTKMSAQRDEARDERLKPQGAIPAALDRGRLILISAIGGAAILAMIWIIYRKRRKSPAQPQDFDPGGIARF